MQQAQSENWTDSEWHKIKRQDAEQAKARDAYIAELKNLLPQWIGDGLTEHQLYNMVSAWNELKRPPLAPVEYIPIVEQVWAASQKKQHTTTEDVTKAEAEEKPEPPPLFKNIDSILKATNTKYLIEPFLPAKGLVLISSLPAVGKTRIAIAIAVALIRQGSLLWHKYQPESYGSVYLMDAENPHSYLKDIISYYDIKANEPIYISHFDGLDISRDYARIRDAILLSEGKLPKAIIVDSFTRLHSADENAASEIKKVMEAFRNLANDLDVIIILLHHERKSAGSGIEKSRGSIDITAAVDSVISLTRCEDTVKLTPVKVRGKRFQPITLQDNGIGFCVLDSQPVMTNLEIVTDILEGREMSTQEIKEAAEKQGYTVGINQLEKLLHARFERVKEGRKVKWRK